MKSHLALEETQMCVTSLHPPVSFAILFNTLHSEIKISNCDSLVFLFFLFLCFPLRENLNPDKLKSKFSPCIVLDTSALVTISGNLSRKLWCWNTRVNFRLSKHLMSSGVHRAPNFVTLCFGNCWVTVEVVITTVIGEPFLQVNVRSIIILLTKINTTIINFSKEIFLNLSLNNSNYY